MYYVPNQKFFFNNDCDNKSLQSVKTQNSKKVQMKKINRNKKSYLVSDIQNCMFLIILLFHICNI
jgi:hypothetical protein